MQLARVLRYWMRLSLESFTGRRTPEISRSLVHPVCVAIFRKRLSPTLDPDPGFPILVVLRLLAVSFPDPIPLVVLEVILSIASTSFSGLGLGQFVCVFYIFGAIFERIGHF